MAGKTFTRPREGLVDLNPRSRHAHDRTQQYKCRDVEDLGAIPPVLGHAGELNQALLNLVVNAAHAIGDAVRGSGKKGRIRVRTRVDGDAVVISVSDDGTGIPDEVRDRVFDPFFTTKEVGRGTGQGLAIARSVVVGKHGGELTFDTAPGRGTTFFIRLPIQRVVAPLAEALPRATSGSCSSTTAGVSTGWNLLRWPSGDGLRAAAGARRGQKGPDVVVSDTLRASTAPGLLGVGPPPRAPRASCSRPPEHEDVPCPRGRPPLLAKPPTPFAARRAAAAAPLRRGRRVFGRLDNLRRSAPTGADGRPPTRRRRRRRIVETDAAMSVKVLQIVNSAYFGLAQKMTSIQRSVVYLGIELLKGLTLVAHVFSSLEKAAVVGFSLDRFQDHSLRCARLAKAFLKDSPRAEDAFTAGLVHDIGKLIIAKNLTRQFHEVIDEVRGSDPPRPLFEVERARIGMSHGSSAPCSARGAAAPAVRRPRSATSPAPALEGAREFRGGARRRRCSLLVQRRGRACRGDSGARPAAPLSERAGYWRVAAGFRAIAAAERAKLGSRCSAPPRRRQRCGATRLRRASGSLCVDDEANVCAVSRSTCTAAASCLAARRRAPRASRRWRATRRSRSSSPTCACRA
jgi:hypothetical protein